MQRLDQTFLSVYNSRMSACSRVQTRRNIMAVAFHRPDEAKKPRRVYYPTRDGKPMAETEKHRKLMTYCIESLENYYMDQADVTVSGNNFLFYEEDNPKARVSPDCYVVFG